jgi:hypothetical protein
VVRAKYRLWAESLLRLLSAAVLLSSWEELCEFELIRDLLSRVAIKY